MPKQKEKWYAGGLQFECTQCGNCCSGDPGYVWATEEEIALIAKFLGAPDGRLDRSYLRRVGSKFSLTEKADGDCVFLERRGGKSYCGIYSVRPLQCRTWPFWDELLRTPESWAKASRQCPGMNTGPEYTYVQIEARRTQEKW